MSSLDVFGLNTHSLLPGRQLAFSYVHWELELGKAVSRDQGLAGKA